MSKKNDSVEEIAEKGAPVVSIAPDPGNEKVISTGSQLLWCRLTDAEVAEHALEATRLFERATALEEEEKQRKLRAKDDIDSLWEATARCTRLAARAKELRSTPVEDRAFWAENVVRTIRLDTCEVVGERALSVEERQGSLFRD